MVGQWALIRETQRLYTAFIQVNPLSQKPIQYADLPTGGASGCGEVLGSNLAYWRQLSDNPMLNLPTDHPHRRFKPIGATQPIELPRQLTKALEELSQQVTLFMTLLAAFQTLLYRYTGQDDIPVGSPIANRNHSQLEGLASLSTAW